MRITDDTTAVIIGGGGGVGRGIALGLAAKGARTVIADIDGDTAAAVADELSRLGHRSVAATVDATDTDSLIALADTAETAFGAIDILSNNVGVVHSGELLDATESEWGWVIEFNLMTIVRACAVIAPRILAHGRGGHIVNTASMAGLWASRPEEVSGTHLGLYTTTKHAVVGYTETLRGELADDGIGVSCLCPGTVDSNLMQTSMKHRPERFGGSVEVGATLGAMPYAMAQEDVGRFVVAGIEDDRTLILTHPRGRRFVDQRHLTHTEDFEYFAALEAEIRGDEIRGEPS
jgi:NAD(P)-dependent dehydrogenase (short-subunit alcohol dehydrogenase family)